MLKNKKVPLRKCVGCGEMKLKKELMRVICTQDNQFLLDTTGKKNGRGAYICNTTECLETAMKTKGLERSFKTAIPKEVYAQLQEEMNRIEDK